MTRIIFASCMESAAGGSQKVWKQAIAHQPDWLVLGGDNIYMDYWPNLNQSKKWSLQKFKDEMFQRYARQFAMPSFQALVKTIPQGQVIGVWDDHDFAWNNCYGTDPTDDMPHKRHIATSLYHHYFDALNVRPLPAALPPLAIPDLKNPPNGNKDIYRALTLGPATALLCDGRKYRERNPHGSDPVSLLGPAQEKWLFDELAKSDAPFIIFSGSTMTAGDDQSWDYYQDFFNGRFLPAVKGKTVIFVGGDVHKNRLPPKKPDWPVEAVSSAAALGFPYINPKFAIIELDEKEARFFLYKDGKIEYTGKHNLNTNKFKTNMVLTPKAVAPKFTAAQAKSQRTQAMKLLAGVK